MGVQASFLSASFFAHGGHCEVCEVVAEDVTPQTLGEFLLIFGFSAWLPVYWIVAYLCQGLQVYFSCFLIL